MKSISPLMTLIDAYGVATGIADKTLSFRVFKDSKKIAALRDGADITTNRLDEAVAWFSENWPEDAAWPKGVVRPARQANGAAA